MSERWLATGAWVAFVLILGIAAHLALAACDLGFHPLFGLNYCQAQAATDPLAPEREHERDLLDRLHGAQLKLSRLPLCRPETPRREPDRRAEDIVPGSTLGPTLGPTLAPTPAPTPAPALTPAPTPSPNDKLVIPSNLNELNGCWQSDRGDINMVRNDENHTLIGKVRICYCLEGNGRGSTRYIYQDGDKCIGGLQAQLSGDQLTMNHGHINCTGNKGNVVPTDITCRTKAGEDSATCNTYVHLKRPTRTTDEKYRRVSSEYCN